MRNQVYFYAVQIIFFEQIGQFERVLVRIIDAAEQNVFKRKRSPRRSDFSNSLAASAALRYSSVY